MKAFRMLSIAAVGLAFLVAAGGRPDRSTSWTSAVARAGEAAPDARLRYGTPVEVGNGRARAYVVTDRSTDAPLEIGIALDEGALEGLPADGSGHHGGGLVTHEFLIDLPAKHGTQFQFVEMNWNPGGHEPPGVYDTPHFDFHFYTVPKSVRESIVPNDSGYAAKANDIPTGDLVPPFTLPLGPPGVPPAGIAVPKMGVHWVDVRSPELQAILGNPEGQQPFTSTFIIGSWDGRFHFWEPMITRAHILEKRSTTDPAVRDQVIPIANAAKYQQPGWYPVAYRITWDSQAKEYRIALTGLARR